MTWTARYAIRFIEVKTPDGGVEHINRIERAQRFGVEDRIPEEPEVSDAGMHILEWFWLLNSRRVMGMEMPHPLSFHDIHAWIQLTNTHILYEEINALLEMDMAYLAQLAENRQGQKSK